MTLRIFWACSLVLLVAHVALADVRTEARRHFRRGMELIAAGNVDEGIASLQEAYDTLPHPNVLYNIARAYAETSRYDEALEYFEQYLASDPPDREEVEAFIAALRTRIDAAQPRADGPVESQQTDAPDAGDEEIRALEESATQIETLAEATQSESLRQRARTLRAIAAELRARAAGTADPDADPDANPDPDPDTDPETDPDPGSLLVELGEEHAQDDLYEEEVVSASRFAQSPLDAPNATTNITRQDIRLSGQVNIGELLRRVPGADVMTLTPADTPVSFRGFNQRLSPRTLVLIDGRSVYIDPLGATLWHSVPFNVEDIERIEVIRGPASALYGADAFSGIVNIITRAPGEPRTDVVMGGGNGGRIHAHASTSGREGRFGYRVAGGYNQADRYSREVSDDRIDHEFAVEERDLALRAAHLNVSSRYRFSREAEGYVQGGVNNAFINFQGTGPLRDFVSQGPFAHAMAGLNTSWGSLRAFWNGLFAEASLPAPPRGGDALTSTFRWNTFDVEAELAREFHFLVDHNLHLGAAYRRKQIDWDFLDQEQFENHGAVFFQDSLTILRRLILVGSFRLDFHPLLSKPVFSPRGALVLRPTDGSALRASVGTAFRTQTFLESYLQLRNPTPVRGVDVLAMGSEPAHRQLGRQRLTPERILSAELGYRNADSDYFDVDASVYYNRVTDLVILSQVQPFTLQQVGDGIGGLSDGQGSFSLGTISFENDPSEFDVVGGELETRIYPVTGLDIYANYALNRTFVTNSQLRDDEERTSLHKLNLGVQYRSPFGLDVALDFHWVSDQVWLEQVFDAEQGVVFREFPIDAYYLLNGRVGLRLFDDALELGIAATNITRNRVRNHPFGQRLDTRVLGTVAYHY